ncbi:MAG TPA: L-dopachrome tautomerase-related protein [Coleofasciculaceae cyanobacterium]
MYLPQPITANNSFVNDLAVAPSHQAIYIADPAGGDNAALIIVELTTGLARRVLQGHQSVTPEDVDLVIDGKPVQRSLPDGKTVKPRIGVNPIALDTNNEWLYYGPMHGTTLYRIRTADLLNPSLSKGELAAKVERYSEKPICDGISIDKAGNIYLGELAANAIGVITPQRRYQRLVQDNRLLSWIDAFSFGPDGKLYTVSNQLHRTAVLNAGKDETFPPFYILRLEPFAPGIVGR